MEIMLYGSAGSLTVRQREIWFGMFCLQAIPQACLQTFSLAQVISLIKVWFLHFLLKIL
jgi:hypothetical protein